MMYYVHIEPDLLHVEPTYYVQIYRFIGTVVELSFDIGPSLPQTTCSDAATQTTEPYAYHHLVLIATVEVAFLRMQAPKMPSMIRQVSAALHCFRLYPKTNSMPSRSLLLEDQWPLKLQLHILPVHSFS